MKNESIRFAKHPDGLPDASCFEFTQEQVIRPAHGEVLIENHLLSVDPYIRMRMEERDSYAPVMAIGDVMVGRTVGDVVGHRVGRDVLRRICRGDVARGPADHDRQLALVINRITPQMPRQQNRIAGVVDRSAILHEQHRPFGDRLIPLFSVPTTRKTFPDQTRIRATSSSFLGRLRTSILVSLSSRR
mgnify:CR=1 FL=1